MGAFRPDPDWAPLTQAEFDALPDGTEVIITWAGGNGAHHYFVAHDRWGNIGVVTGLGPFPNGVTRPIRTEMLDCIGPVDSDGKYLRTTIWLAAMAKV